MATLGNESESEDIFGLEESLLFEMGMCSAFTSVNSYSHMYSHTHTQTVLLLTIFKSKFVSPSSLGCVVADSEKTDFDPLLFPSFLIQSQNKGKGALAIQRQAGLVSSSLFPSEPQTDQLSFEVSFMPVTKGQERVIIFSSYLHFIQVI